MTNKFSVDRVRFLAVAAALAGVASFQACTVNNNTTTKGDDHDGGESGSKNTAGSTMAAAGANEGGAPAGGGGASGTVGGADEGGAAQGGASSNVGGADEGGAAQGGAAQGGASSCDDTVGDPSCEGVSDACWPHCVAALTNLKPAAALDAVNCLEADTTDYCDAGYTCLTAATAKGCPEDVTAACAAAETACTPDDTAPPCAQLLSGLNDEARAEAITCTEESCYSVYNCAADLFYINP